MTLLLWGLIGWWMGAELLAQLRGLREQLPRSLDSLRAWLAATPLGSQGAAVLDDLRHRDISWTRLAGAARVKLGALGNTVLVLLLAVFVATEPDLYRSGALRLLPPAAR